MSARCQTCKNAFTFDPLFLFEGASNEGPAISYLSPEPSKILPHDLLRSAVAPAKSWNPFKLLGRSSFSSSESSSVSLSLSSFGGKITNFPLEMKSSSSDKSSSEDKCKFSKLHEH